MCNLEDMDSVTSSICLSDGVSWSESRGMEMKLKYDRQALGGMSFVTRMFSCLASVFGRDNQPETMEYEPLRRPRGQCRSYVDTPNLVLPHVTVALSRRGERLIMGVKPLTSSSLFTELPLMYSTILPRAIHSETVAG